MKYCLKYEENYKSKYYDSCDELKINLNEINPNIVNFIEAHPNQRINIKVLFQGDLDIEKSYLSSLAKKYNNIVYTIITENEELAKFFIAERIPFYFRNPIYNYEDLFVILKEYPQVTDIYISGELAFNLIAIKNIVGDRNIRVIANKVQFGNDYFNITGEDTILGFFIRPEDIAEYEKYVDVIEFVYKQEKNQDTFYEIYSKDHLWYGDLAEIISGLELHLDSRMLIPYFAAKRIQCNKKCMKGYGCDACHRAIPLMEAMEESEEKYFFYKEKEK